MEENFKLLLDRILDTNRVSDLKQIIEELSKISNSVICVGSGGSNIVSEYASKVFNHKNKCISLNLEPRDLLYINKEFIENIFICSYSGNNYGVEMALCNNKKNYLFTNQNIFKNKTCILQYNSTLPKEKSFISLAATLMPMSILLNYYMDGNNFDELLFDVFNNIENLLIEESDTFEIMSGMDTSVASTFLESTLVEAGLANPILHSKYNYCHGRTTLTYNRPSSLIYITAGMKDIDEVILDEAEKLYKSVVILESNYNDIIIDNFNLTVKAMFLAKQIADLKKKDLSKVKYAPAVKKLYHFKGGM